MESWLLDHQRSPYIFFFFFPKFLFIWLHWVLIATCGILVPWPGIEPRSPAWEAMNLSHWAAREVPPRSYLDPDLKKLRECLCVVEYLTRYLMILRNYWYISSVQFSCSVVFDSLRPHEPQHARPPGPSPTPRVHPNPCPSSRWCHPTISSSVAPFFPCPQSFASSGNESALRIMWPKYWSFSFNISPANEHPGLISFRMDWLDLLAVQGTLKSLLQHHSSKASILWLSAFFTVQLSHP